MTPCQTPFAICCFFRGGAQNRTTRVIFQSTVDRDAIAKLRLLEGIKIIFRIQVQNISKFLEKGPVLVVDDSRSQVLNVPRDPLKNKRLGVGWSRCEQSKNTNKLT